MNIIEFLQKIETKHIFLEEINEGDLYGIIELRTLKLNNYLSPITTSIENQLEYFNKYKIKRLREGELYYKILDKKDLSKITGLVRLTEINNPEKFSWESLIIADGSPPYISLDAMMTIYRIGFEILDKEICGPWTIPIDAKNVYSLHKKVGMASEIECDSNYYYMVVTKPNFLKRYDFFRKMGYGLYNL